jgi:hypothetical protein
MQTKLPQLLLRRLILGMSESAWIPKLPLLMPSKLSSSISNEHNPLQFSPQVTNLTLIFTSVKLANLLGGGRRRRERMEAESICWFGWIGERRDGGGWDGGALALEDGVEEAHDDGVMEVGYSKEWRVLVVN